MLKTKTITVKTTAVAEKEKATYELCYQVTDNILSCVTCTIYAIKLLEMPAPDGVKKMQQFEMAGTIEQKDGRITLSAFASDLPVAEYLTTFNELVKEITPKTVEVK